MRDGILLLSRAKSRNVSLVNIEKVGKGLRTSLPKLFEQILILLCAENQKIIHSIFHEVILLKQLVTGLIRLPNHDFSGHAMILAIPIAVDHSYPSPWCQRPAQVSQQCDWLSDFVIRLQKEHGVNFRGQERIIRFSQDGFDVVQVLFEGSGLDVADGLGIYVDGIHGSGFTHPPGCADREPPGPCSDVSDRFAWSNRENVHNAIDLQPFVSSGGIKD